MLLVLVTGLLAGCGGGSGGVGGVGGSGDSAGTAPESQPPSTTPPLSTFPPPTLARPTAPPTTPTDAFKPLTLRGVVAESARDDCVELVVGTVRYALVGEAASDLAAGDAVEVRGVPAPQRETGCDGATLLVRSVRATGGETLPPSGDAAFTVRGMVQPGVEAGCPVVSSRQGTFLLVGPEAARAEQLRPGTEVTVTGTPATGAVTTCQQGTPLEVHSIRVGLAPPAP